MDKYKKIIIFFLCLCIAFFPVFIPLAIHAEGGYTYDLIDAYNLPSSSICLTLDGYQHSSIYVEGYTPPFSNSYTNNSVYNEFYEKLSNVSVSDALVSFPDYPYFVILSTTTGFQMIFMKDLSNNLLLANNSQISIRLDSNSSYRKLVYNSSSKTFSVENPSYPNYPLWGNGSDDGIFTWDTINSGGFYILTNHPILYTNQSGSVINQYKSNSSNFSDVNYFTPDQWQNSSGESSSNNLYMDGAKWSFDIPYYSLDQSGATYGTGTATFSGSLNDFQINNSSDFSLEFLFTSFLSGYRYSWAQDSEKEDFSYKYFYSTEIPLSDFYINGQVASFNISDIFDNSISVNPIHLGTSITEDCQVISNSQAVNITNWNTTFTVALKSNDEYSGKCSTMYSYLLRKSKNKDNSMQTNENPYLGEEGSNSSPDSDIFNGDGVSGSSGNSNSTANIGDYSVVNNNNPQITINNNNDNGFTNAIENGDSDGLLSKLLLLLANNQSTTSSGISEIADTSGYVQVMGSVFTAVPSAWWTTLTVAFVACIGILVVSFVIKIILKFVI